MTKTEIIPGIKANVLTSGEVRISGLIRKITGSDEYEIGSRRFHFAPGLSVNGTQFDQLSRDAMIGGEYDALFKNTDAGLTLTAAVPRGLFSASKPASDFGESHLNRSLSLTTGKFEADVHAPEFKEFVNYRRTLFSNAQVKEGDVALVLTFSGAQGDDPTAVLGHFAFGELIVGADGELDGAINNFYPVENEKLLEPGFMSPIDYFGNLVGGQSQYRATFTLVLYGIDPSAIARAKKQIETTFVYLKAHPKFQVVSSFNCTTETCRALQTADLDPNRVSDFSALLPIETLAKKYASADASATRWERFMYFLVSDPAQIFPRLAFENALGACLREQKLGDARITRADLIFQGQLPSARARGALAAGSVWEYLKGAAQLYLRRLF